MHHQRGISETSQRESTAKRPDSSSLHEALSRSDSECLLNQQSSLFEHFFLLQVAVFVGTRVL